MTSPVLRSPSNCVSLILAAALGNVSSPMAPASSAVSLHQISGPEALPHTDSPARNQDDDWQLALLSPHSTLSDIWRAYAHNIRLIRKHQDTHPSSDDADDDNTCLNVAVAPNVHERWYREFGTSPDVSNAFQESTVGGVDVFSEVRYALVYPEKSLRRDDREIEAELEDRMQKKRTQLWIKTLQDRAQAGGT
ncbi:hypothetical protein B0H10DRAFT_2197434 [Mycena sp. CBHHK59/15]|nr:hypothetical protein B0H10DRAFT_2197434 [Mycena sp. CBHHK59/15]